MTTNYRRGVAVEYAAIEKLEAAGWYAQRSAGSKGESDVLAIRKGPGNAHLFDGCVVAALVNCKRTITECYPDDWNETFEAALAVGAIALVAGRLPGKRGVLFMRMMAMKEKGHPSQPWEPFDLEEEA